ncbi:AAA family ATPase [Armatimonas sp.]|uniref:AAA family ATPase n=1 Tax=Armatimonas sp. TaxID=1872638 RepID=UPI00374D0D9B
MIKNNYTLDSGLISFSVSDFKCFTKDSKLILSESNRPYKWNILIGENGTGKTSILQLITAAFYSIATIPINEKIPIEKGDDLYKKLIEQIKEHSPESTDIIISANMMYNNSNERNFEFRIASQDESSLINSITQSNATMLPDSDVIETNNYSFSIEYTILPKGCGLYYYRGSRKPTYFGENASRDRYVFNQIANDIQINAYEWLFKADYASRVNSDEKTKLKKQRIEKALISILPDVEDFRYMVSDDASMTPIVEAKTPYGWVSVLNLSLGYQTALAWVVDYASQLFDRYPNSTNPLEEPAICLVDEIDLHLHPKWQRQFIENLDKIFSHTQFIVTTHSPLVIQSVPGANLALLERQDDHTYINNDVDEIRTWRIDQILASELFGEQPVYAPEIQALLDERERLLSQAELSEEDTARVAVIDTELEKLPSAARPADQEAMDLIRRTAALIKNEK